MRQNPFKYFSFLVLLLFTVSVGAEVYIRYDQHGRASFSDRPKVGSKELVLKPHGYTWHEVLTVYDGDTIQLKSGLKVRLAGINTPEIEGKNKTSEPGANRAKQVLTSWLEGKQVRLELDSEAKDKYGRTLAYLFTRDQQHINMELVRKGLAAVNLYPPNLKYQRQLLQAQKDAEQEPLGLWLVPEYQPKSIDTLVSSSQRGWQRLLGKVQKKRLERKFAYLDLSNQVDVRIAKSNLELFPALEEYVGKMLEIRGWPARRKNHYSILIRHPSALKIIDQDSVPDMGNTDDS